jgi:hypothetical protein
MQHYKEASIQFHAPVAFLPGKEPCNPWTRVWFDDRGSLGALKKRKNLLPLSGIETLTSHMSSPYPRRCTKFQVVYKIIQEDTQSFI